jgi:predicted lysophospholipase L1 biosynthesis ABC-type transport system permease subunit
MGFFASMIAYLGAVIGIVLALLLPLRVLLFVPSQSTANQQTVAMGPSLSEPAATTNTTMKVTFRIRSRKPRVAPRILDDWLNTANDTSRKRSLYMLARQEHTGHLASHQRPNFASRYMGYVDDPSADRSLVR